MVSTGWPGFRTRVSISPSSGLQKRASMTPTDNAIGGQFLGGQHRVLDQRAVGDERRVVAFAERAALADLPFLGGGLRRGSSIDRLRSCCAGTLSRG